MALADTARLIATLELQDKFSATADKYDRTVAGMQRQTSMLGQIGGQVSQGIGTAVTNLTRLGVLGVGVLGVQVAQGIQSLQRLEEVTVATEAVIESTGGAAGVTAEEVRRLAEEFESLNATMDDKVIQSAENVLLTFTAIGEDVFPQALEAALNMNQALGGGEEGLQGTVIQLGKALQDPIRGLTALRRVGVNFSQQQQDTIRGLVESNRLFEAQQIILQELEREFGGQFAAAGTTATANFAKFRDAIEDAQMALATAFLPVLERVTEKLTVLLSDPATQSALQDLGTNLADAFDDLVEIAGNLPWDAIGSAFQLMGTGAKAVLQAFTAMPPWVQTAILTAWGTNKLTGGALGTIVNTLASGLIKGVLGINAGVVNINAGTVTGGAPGTGGGGGLGGAVAGIVGTAGATAAIGGGVLALSQIASGTEQGVKSGFAAISGGFAGLIGEAVEGAIGDPLGEVVSGQKQTSQKVEQGFSKTANTALTEQQLLRAHNMSRISEAARQAAATARLHDTLQAKKFDPTINVRTTTQVTSNVSITDVTRRLTSQRISQGISGGVTVE